MRVSRNRSSVFALCALAVLAALALAPGCPGWGAWTMAVTSFGLAALVALFYRFRTGKTIIPFGPFLLAGWWLAQEPLQRAWPGGWLW